MSFQLVSPDINNLTGRKLLTNVTIRRHLFRHSWATFVIDADELTKDGDRNPPLANLGASLLNTDVVLKWCPRDKQEGSVDCFRGYVASVRAQHRAHRSYLVIHCVSYSKRADEIPRYRVWQECTLLDICQHIAGKEPLFQIASNAQSILSGNTIELSVQYGETDFAYLSRMLHAWGIPLAVDDRAGKIIIGSPTVSSSGEFPPLNYHWNVTGIDVAIVPLDGKSRNNGAGAPATARQFTDKYNSELQRVAADHFPRLDDDHKADREWITDRVHETTLRGDPAVFRAQWDGALFDFSPGCAVNFNGQTCLVRSVFLKGDPHEDTVTQEFVLQDYLAPLQPHRRKVRWASRTLWAHVINNNHEDPQQRGRIQVKFDWEDLDPTSGEDKCWLPTLTPYGGLKGTSGTSGFLSLPEVGEHVLVQFLDEWDSDAVVIGSVREYGREGFKYDPHETKRWQTPSGNQVTLTTRQNGTDIVRIKCKDKLIFEGRIDSSKQVVIMDLCDSDDDRVHFQKGGGPTQLDIFCSANIYMHAEQKLYIEGGQVQITSKTGNVNIKSAANVEVQGMTIDVDGSAGVNIDGAMVKLNSPPAVPHTHWSLTPLQRPPDDAQEGPAKQARKRKKTPWQASAAAAQQQQQQPQEERTWIEIELIDEVTREPIPNERYRLKLPDGSIREGRLDANGRARVDGIVPGTAQVCFPDIDANEWRPA